MQQTTLSKAVVATTSSRKRSAASTTVSSTPAKKRKSTAGTSIDEPIDLLDETEEVVIIVDEDDKPDSGPSEPTAKDSKPKHDGPSNRFPTRINAPDFDLQESLTGVEAQVIKKDPDLDLLYFKQMGTWRNRFNDVIDDADGSTSFVLHLYGYISPHLCISLSMPRDCNLRESMSFIDRSISMDSTAVKGRFLFEYLLNELPWYRVTYQTRGITIRTPRWTNVWGCDETGAPPSAYKIQPRKIPPVLRELKEHMEVRTGAKYNFVLVNYYENG